MKWLKGGVSIALVLCVLAVSGCANSGSTSQETSTEKTGGNYWTLEDYLRRANGVQIVNRGGELQVIIRGNSSIADPGNQPLFVVDGQKAGRSFTRVSNMFSRGEIVSVKVLPAGAASQYGMEGNYGVIVIKSK